MLMIGEELRAQFPPRRTLESRSQFSPAGRDRSSNLFDRGRRRSDKARVVELCRHCRRRWHVAVALTISSMSSCSAPSCACDLPMLSRWTRKIPSLMCSVRSTFSCAAARIASPQERTLVGVGVTDRVLALHPARIAPPALHDFDHGRRRRGAALRRRDEAASRPTPQVTPPCIGSRRYRCPRR